MKQILAHGESSAADAVVCEAAAGAAGAAFNAGSQFTVTGIYLSVGSTAPSTSPVMFRYGRSSEGGLTSVAILKGPSSVAGQNAHQYIPMYVQTGYAAVYVPTGGTTAVAAIIYGR